VGCEGSLAPGSAVDSAGFAVNGRIEESIAERVLLVRYGLVRHLLVRLLLCNVGLSRIITPWLLYGRLVLERNLALIDHRLQQLKSLSLLVILQHLIRLQYLQSQRDIVLLVQYELRSEVLHLSVQETECVRICELKVVQDVDWQFFVRLSDFVDAVRVGAVLAKLANLVLLVVLAFLGLEVVVGDVQQLVLHFNRQRLQANETN